MRTTPRILFCALAIGAVTLAPALAQNAQTQGDVPEVQRNPGNAVGGSPQNSGRSDSTPGIVGSTGGPDGRATGRGGDIPEVARNPGNAVGNAGRGTAPAQGTGSQAAPSPSAGGGTPSR